MTGRQVVGALAAVGVVGAGAIGLAAGGAAAPAHAAFNGKCATTVPAAVLVADGVCEVRFSAPGAFSFTPPSGITKLAAVLVGAGGGAGIQTGNHFSYAGSGGTVVYIDSVPLGAPVTGTVGAGGTASEDLNTTAPTAGANTVVGATTANGGAEATAGEAGCAFAPNIFFYGNGAQTASQGGPACAPGVGFSLSQLAGVDTSLFPTSADGTDVYGNGGAANETDPGVVSAVAGSGGSVGVTQAAPGSDGLVIFRFAAAPTLAATGTSVSWTVPGASAALIAVGALLLALRRRRRTQH